jgi:hypothetical protein
MVETGEQISFLVRMEKQDDIFECFLFNAYTLLNYSVGSLFYSSLGAYPCGNGNYFLELIGVF